jgi:superfamily II DNA or RNA helicase
MIKLQEHQLNMLAAMRLESKGIIQAPTGTGKTFVQAARCLDFINNEFNVQVVCTPRIGLTNQVAKEYIKYFKDQGKSRFKYKTIIVHSGSGVNDDVDFEGLTEYEILSLKKGMLGDIKATSFTSEFLDIISTSQKQNKPLIVFTTYHSVKDKVIEVLNSLGIDISCNINDEAHYLTQEGFSVIPTKFNTDNQYFFTATPINSSSNKGRGMNNTDRFGKTIYQLSFKEAVELGIILDVDVRILQSQNVNTTQDILDKEIGETIETAYKSVVNTYPNIGAKLLVAVRDAQQMSGFIKSKEYKQLINNKVEILTVHSNKDITTHNGKIITRKSFDQLKDKFGSNPNVNMIIVHYDILAEGIDIPGLLGVLILRNLKTAKFMQTVGRVVRTFRNNPSLKTKGLVLFPDLDKDMFIEFSEMIKTLIKEYNYPIEDLREQLIKGVEEDEDESVLEGRLGRINNIDFDLQLIEIPLTIGDHECIM